MRITCVIDNLGSGGAQRQMSLLAVLLNGRGHDVRLVTYYPNDFYKSLLDEAGVRVECVRHRSKLHRIWAVRKAIRAGRPEVVIAYLQTPSILAELASLPRRDYGLIVSERSLDYSGRKIPKRTLSFWLHRLADAIVTNSHAQEAIIHKVVPKLAPRVTTILNCVDLHQFRPAAIDEKNPKGVLRILCVGRFDAEKNYLRLVEAVEIVNCRYPEINLVIDAYGSNHFVDDKPGPQSGDFLKLQDALKRSPAQARFRLHDPVKNVAPLYQGSDALCLASLYEGCSNAICEAMACGRPVLASRVGDNPVLIEDGINGFLFDPNNSVEIANAIVRFSKLSPEQRIAMGKAGRQRAEELLSPERFVEQYEQLIEILQQRTASPNLQESAQTLRESSDCDKRQDIAQRQ